jgi:hypothetical protein
MRLLGPLALLASVAALLVGDPGGPSGPGGNLSLEEARSFDEFPLYYAGDEIDGLPLRAVLRREGDADYVSFVYGDCTPASDAGCAPPAEVQVWAGRARNARSYDTSASGTPAPAHARIRGLPAAFVSEGALEIYTEEATIVVFGDSRDRALAIAGALRCLRRTGDGARDGRLECRP